MQDAQYWMTEFWAGLSLLDLVGGTVLGGALGLLLGILTWRLLHGRGWLPRRRRWHHWLVALHALVLPLLFAFTGAQLGFVAGAQRALYQQIDHFQPQLQQLMGAWKSEFEQSLDAQSLSGLVQGDQSFQQAAESVVGAYLRQHPLPGNAYLQGDGWLMRGGRAGLEWMRAALMSSWVEDGFAEELAGRTGLDESVARQALTMRMDELLHSQGVIRLLKAQLNSMMPGLYFGALLPLLIMMGLVFLEIGLAFRYRWIRPPMTVADLLALAKP